MSRASRRPHKGNSSRLDAARTVESPRTSLQHGPAKGSVRSLQELYTVAVGVAVVKAMEVFVGPAAEHSAEAVAHIRWTSWPGLVALMATLVPFYHGAMRHLDKTYIEDRGVLVKQGSLLADFLWLFIEAGILLGMALQIADLKQFTWWLVFLLGFDSAWGLFVHIVLTSKRRALIEFKWAIINAATIAVLIGVILSASRWGGRDLPALLWIGVPVVAILRTIIDYAWSWAFYFPMEPVSEPVVER